MCVFAALQCYIHKRSVCDDERNMGSCLFAVLHFLFWVKRCEKVRFSFIVVTKIERLSKNVISLESLMDKCLTLVYNLKT